MRRSDREVKHMDDIMAIVRRCQVVRLGLVDRGEAYIVPVNFGYERDGDRLTLYFHGALEGRKASLIQSVGHAGFEMDGAHALIEGERADQYSYAYECVMGTGAATLVTNMAEKTRGLEALMEHMTGKRHEIDEQAVRHTAVFKLTVETISAKKRPMPE